MPRMLPYIAQTSRSTADIYFWLMMILIAVAVLIAVAFFVRKYLRDNEEWQPDPFSLSDLRRLHADGQLTDDEYERAKAAIIAQTKATMTKGDPDPDG